MEGKAAVLGSMDFVKAFAALGLDTFPVEPRQDMVEQTARDILQKKYTLIIVAETVARMAAEVFETVERQPVPCVLVMPYLSESTGVATQALRHSLRLATGIDMLAD